MVYVHNLETYLQYMFIRLPPVRCWATPTSCVSQWAEVCSSAGALLSSNLANTSYVCGVSQAKGSRREQSAVPVGDGRGRSLGGGDECTGAAGFREGQGSHAGVL